MILREFSSGGVIFKKKSNNIYWLVCKSAPTKEYPGDYWRLPKGWIDDSNGGENPGPISSGEIKATEDQLQDAALREVREEGGVNAKIIKKIGTTRYFITSTRGRVMKFVTYYLMEWVDDLPEGFGFETEKTEWLNLSEAVKRLDNRNEKDMLKRASETA